MAGDFAGAVVEPALTAAPGEGVAVFAPLGDLAPAGLLSFVSTLSDLLGDNGAEGLAGGGKQVFCLQ